MQVYNTLVREHVAFPSKELFPIKYQRNQEQYLRTSLSEKRLSSLPQQPSQHLSFPSRAESTFQQSRRIQLTNPGGMLLTDANSRNVTDRDLVCSMIEEVKVAGLHGSQEQLIEVERVKARAKALVRDYQTLRKQMTEVESSAGVLPREKLQSYLDFSEQYLEQLLSANLAIKGKEAKVLKISSYNQMLTQLLTGEASRAAASSESDQKEAADNLVLISTKGQAAERGCTRCMDLVP